MSYPSDDPIQGGTEQEVARCPACELDHRLDQPCPPPEPRVGDRLGPYYLQELVGQGGMGRVFRAVHEKLGRTVAIKLMRRSVSYGEGAKRFLREARAVNKAHHPHLVEITDIVEAPPGGDSYYVMEWLLGKSLHARMVECNGHIPLPEMLRIAIEVTEGLEAAHKAGLVHRDLKPENIYLIHKDGRHDFVKVLDFGVAQDLNERETEDYIVGTPAYIAPEQAVGEPGGPHSDIYSLGVILYELAVGHLPFEGATMDEMLAKHLAGNPVRPRQAAPPGIHIPPRLEQIILRCMAEDPRDRYPDMAALRRDLLSLTAKSWLPLLPVLQRVHLIGLDRMEAVKLPPWLAELDVRRVARRGLLVLAGVAAVSLGWHFHESAGDLKGGILQPAPPPEPDREEPLPLQVEVRTVPSGAEVRYGGTVLGITPCVVRLPEGKREIELRRAGYRRDKRMVDVHIGAQVRVKLLR